MPVKGGSAKEMGPPSKKLYKRKLFVSLLFKGLILDSPGNSYSAEKAGAGQWEFSFLNDSLLRQKSTTKKEKAGHTFRERGSVVRLLRGLWLHVITWKGDFSSGGALVNKN